MAKGYWIANVDVSNADGYKPYSSPTLPDFQEIRRTLSCAAARSSAWKASARTRCDHRISRLCRRAGLLPLARIPGEHRAAAAAVEADLIVIEGYDGPQP